MDLYVPLLPPIYTINSLLTTWSDMNRSGSGTVHGHEQRRSDAVREVPSGYPLLDTLEVQPRYLRGNFEVNL
jgi:hypothetical protein